MRFHVKRLVIGIWMTTVLGFLLVVLLLREGNDTEKLKRDVFPRQLNSRGWKGIKPLKNATEPTKRWTIRSTTPSAYTKQPSNLSVTTRAPGFHPAIHDFVHDKQQNAQAKPVRFQVTEEHLLKYKHLLEITPEQRVYSHNDYNVSHVWPREHETDDRIVAQLRHQPKVPGGGKRKPLTILVYNGLPTDAEAGSGKFVKDKCAVQECVLSTDIRKAKSADVILFQNTISLPYQGPKVRNQNWVLFFLESAKYTLGLQEYKGMINMTATYRRDSHIVTPYEKFVPSKDIKTLPEEPVKNFAKNKVKQVAWFVSNCGTSNGRLSYAQELQKYIAVDIYGGCGKLHCFRSRAKECFKMLSNDYKFYLAFENSNCKDYITEKLYWNGLYNDIIPVVMGASRSDYASVAPPHSYIHVDDFDSPRELAEYLHILDQNDDLYNRYFLWKNTGEFINTFFWCRLCSMSHEALVNPVWIENPEKWWRNDNTCVSIEGYPGDRWATWNRKSPAKR